jgi:hypothetical protein
MTSQEPEEYFYPENKTCGITTRGSWYRELDAKERMEKRNKIEA